MRCFIEDIGGVIMKIYIDEMVEDKSYYLNITKDILNEFENNILKCRMSDYFVIGVELTLNEEELKGYGGLFIHIQKIIKIKISSKSLDSVGEVNFKEVFMHELRHAIFEKEMITKNNFYIYRTNNIGIVYINEYLAYYNNYKYLVEYYKNRDYDYRNKLRRDYFCNMSELTDINFKYSGKFENIKEESELDKLINKIARKVALYKILEGTSIFNEKDYLEAINKLPTQMIYTDIVKVVKDYDERVIRFIKEWILTN